MSFEEARGDGCEVWPDNVISVNAFIAMATQWRIGPCGATGLDYNALPVVMSMAGIKKRDRPSVFEDVRTMEDAALVQMRNSK